MQPPPRPASNTNAAAVRFIRTYSGRCALVGRRRALGSRGRGMSKLRVIVGSGTPATLNKTGMPGTAGVGPALGWGLWVAVDLPAGPHCRVGTFVPAPHPPLPRRNEHVRNKRTCPE